MATKEPVSQEEALDGTCRSTLGPGGDGDAQTASRFLDRLPQEVRDKIYTAVFSSATLTIRAPKGSSAPSPEVAGGRHQSSSNVLSLLRTCRRVRSEIGITWLGQVLFTFKDAWIMVDRLAALPTTSISQIRRVRLHAASLKIPLASGVVYVSLASALSFLPGLRLDEFTVLGGYLTILNGNTVNDLVKSGNGWKTLRYLCATSAILNVLAPRLDWAEEMRYVPVPNFGGWHDELVKRDGAASGPSVAFYRSTKQRAHDKFSGNPSPVGSAHEELEKTVLVEVSRGSGADFQVREGAGFLDAVNRFQGGTPTKISSWAEVRSLCSGGPDKGWTPLLDYGLFDDVDEHGWTRISVKNGVISAEEAAGAAGRGILKL